MTFAFFNNWFTIWKLVKMCAFSAILVWTFIKVKNTKLRWFTFDNKGFAYFYYIFVFAKLLPMSANQRFFWWSFIKIIMAIVIFLALIVIQLLTFLHHISPSSKLFIMSTNIKFFWWLLEEHKLTINIFITFIFLFVIVTFHYNGLILSMSEFMSARLGVDDWMIYAIENAERIPVACFRILFFANIYSSEIIVVFRQMRTLKWLNWRNLEEFNFALLMIWACVIISDVFTFNFSTLIKFFYWFTYNFILLI